MPCLIMHTFITVQCYLKMYRYFEGRQKVQHLREKQIAIGCEAYFKVLAIADCLLIRELC